MGIDFVVVAVFSALHVMVYCTHVCAMAALNSLPGTDVGMCVYVEHAYNCLCVRVSVCTVTRQPFKSYGVGLFRHNKCVCQRPQKKHTHTVFTYSSSFS